MAGTRVAVVGLMGAPLVTKERLPDPDHVLRPVRLMEEFVGRKFDAVMSIEIGSENSILPLMVSALAGIPVVDADTMGRAFPEAQMASFAIRDLPLTPFVISDIRDNDLIITQTEDAVWTERIGRRVCTELGSIVATCSAPRTGREVKEHAHPRLGQPGDPPGPGRALRRRRHESPIEAVMARGTRRASVPRQGSRRGPAHDRRLRARRGPDRRGRGVRRSGLSWSNSRTSSRSAVTTARCG